MKKLVALSACWLLIGSMAAVADEKPSAEEAEKIKATLSAWGCTGGEIEKESEGTGVFEVDDAKCKDGQQFDIKIGSDFTVRSMTRD